MAFTSVKKMGREVYHVMSPYSWIIANLVFMPLLHCLFRISTTSTMHAYSWTDILIIFSVSVPVLSENRYSI